MRGRDVPLARARSIAPEPAGEAWQAHLPAQVLPPSFASDRVGACCRAVATW